MSKIQKAEERIKKNEWDIEAWNALLREAQCKDIEEARPIYERFTAQFPMSGAHVKQFIQAEMKAKQFNRVEQLFKQYLPKILHIDLWKFYLSYIKEKEIKNDSFKENMAKAYDFVLERMGLDLKSYSIWNDYVNFFKSTQVHGSYAESQKITATRRVYQRAIVTPMLNIENMWREYSAYENAINPLIGKKFTEERSKDYMNARRVAKEYEAITRGLNRSLLSVPPQNTAEEQRQVELWKHYIEWEKENPLRTDDVATVTKRTMFAYEQCLLCLGHHPDIWYEAAAYLGRASRLLSDKGDVAGARKFAEETAFMYKRALHVLPESTLLYLAYADYEEARCNYAEVHAIYNRLIGVQRVDPTLAYIHYMRFSRRAQGIRGARSVFRKARADPRCQHHVFVNAALLEHFCSKQPAIAQRIFELGMRTHQHNSHFVLCYLDYMTHMNEDNNTRVLFERTLEAAPPPPQLHNHHNEKSTNQDQSAAATTTVTTTTTTTVASSKVRQIWDRFLQLELLIGDLSSIVQVERRRVASLTQSASSSSSAAANRQFKGRETALLIDRYRFLDLLPCNETELRALGYNHHVVQHSQSGGAPMLIGSLSDLLSSSAATATSTMSSSSSSAGGGGGGATNTSSSSILAAASSSNSASNSALQHDDATTGGGIDELDQQAGLSLPAVAAASALIGGGGGSARQEGFPQPDTSQMLPFKPKAFPRTGSHVVPGGEFPPPPAASALLKLLPPPSCFHGPFVHVDKMIADIAQLALAPDYQTHHHQQEQHQQHHQMSGGGGGGAALGGGDVIDPGTANSIEVANASSHHGFYSRKRRHSSTTTTGGGIGGGGLSATDPLAGGLMIPPGGLHHSSYSLKSLMEQEEAAQPASEAGNANNLMGAAQYSQLMQEVMEEGAQPPHSSKKGEAAAGAGGGGDVAGILHSAMNPSGLTSDVFRARKQMKAVQLSSATSCPDSQPHHHQR